MCPNALTESFNPLDAIRAVGATELYAATLLRNNVAEIIGSYHHPFDHLYECVQNAVDACEDAFTEKRKTGKSGDYTPTVKVIVDLGANCLSVIDNGTGMSKDTIVRYFFTPNATLKIPGEDGKPALRQRGEKGVGATFLSYGANKLHLASKHMGSNEITSGELTNALKWCNRKADLLPMPRVNPIDPDPFLEELTHGTVIRIWFSEDTNMASLDDSGTTVERWEAILRIHTALGFISFGEDEFLRLLRGEIVVVDSAGQSTSKQVQTGYLYPHSATESSIRLRELARNAKGQLPETQREMNLLWDSYSNEEVLARVTKRLDRVQIRQKDRKIISDVQVAHRPEAYVAFAYGSEFWEECNQDIWGQEGIHQLDHGIVFATKTQKIGEPKKLDFRFRTGDFNRFFVLLHMQNLKGDIGRKSLPEGVEAFANFFANSIHEEFVEQNDCLKPSPGPFTEEQERNLENLLDLAYQKENLQLGRLHLSRTPTEEQDVIALFFDLLGIEQLRGYECYSTHVHRVYDGVGRFELPDEARNRYNSENNKLGIAGDKFNNGKVQSANKCLFEFKYNTDALVRDVRAGYKRLQDIKWLICWEIGTAHIAEGIGLADITLPPQINHRFYFGVTHIMTEGQDKVYVICLKDVLRILREEGKLQPLN